VLKHCVALPLLPATHADISRDVALYRSLARAAISSSREATNPCGLQPERRLLLSLSPHVVVPDALEKEQQHERALLAQQQHEEAARHHHHHQQQHVQIAELAAVPGQLQQDSSDLVPASAPELRDAAATSYGSIAADSQPQQQQQQQQEAGDIEAAEVDAADAQLEFTDPLRRRTFPGEGTLLSEDEDEEQQQQQHAIELAEDAAELAPARVQPLWLQSMQLYDRCGWLFAVAPFLLAGLGPGCASRVVRAGVLVGQVVASSA
jgi:hypothetical protein